MGSFACHQGNEESSFLRQRYVIRTPLLMVMCSLWVGAFYCMCG